MMQTGGITPTSGEKDTGSSEVPYWYKVSSTSELFRAHN